MAFVSTAQQKRLAELVKQGKMSQETYEKMGAETGDKKLPDRLTPDKRPKTISDLRAISKKKLRK